MKKFFNQNILNMPMPSNISYMWNMGSLLGVMLMIQIISGFFLTMHYSSNIDFTFNYMNHIMRDMNMGWMIRIMHANGASFFFIIVYLHIARGMYFNSFFLWKVWFSGVVIFLLLMMTAFIGYVLPWGQMSFWGATVITNLLTAIPYLGKSVTFWIWGGFSVDSATLIRFFSLHFILPFVLLMMVLLHILFLHEKGSNNPLGLYSNMDKIGFNPYFVFKDLMGFVFLFCILFLINVLWPYMFMDPDNFIPANPMITPPHIQPEWYFLFAYAILRSIPNKLGGVLALLFSIIILVFLPLTRQMSLISLNSMLKKHMYFWFVCNFIMLTYLGACPVETPFIMLAMFFSVMYFLYFVLLLMF